MDLDIRNFECLHFSRNIVVMEGAMRCGECDVASGMLSAYLDQNSTARAMISGWMADAQVQEPRPFVWGSYSFLIVFLDVDGLPW